MVAIIFDVSILISVYALILFVIGISKANNGIMDIAWGLGFCFIALFTFVHYADTNFRQILVTLFTFLWGTRLALHIFKRSKNKPEDFRYANWRKQWGKWFVLRSFFQVYILQGLLMVLVALPVILINYKSSNSLGLFDVLGISLWLTGFYIEAKADKQLADFKNDSKNEGKIMQSGLWRYSRHPNYFGEVVLWWGIFCFAISAGWFWPAFISPVLISYLILKVSGIPMLEHKYKNNPKYEVYVSKTRAFWPLPK